MLFNDERVEPLSDDLDEWRPSTPASLTCVPAAGKIAAFICPGIAIGGMLGMAAGITLIG